MKITKDMLTIQENGAGRYFVECILFEARFASSVSLNKITCSDLIDQIDGLELTERNVLIHDTNANNSYDRPYIVYPAGIKIIFNGEEVLGNYLPYIQPTTGFIVPDYDLLSLKVLKNKMLK